MLKGMSYEEFLKHWNSGGGHIGHRIGNRVYGEKQNTMEEQALADLHATTVRLRALGKEPKIHFDAEKQRAVVHFDNTVLDFCFTEKCAAELERELSHIRGFSNGAIRGEAPLKSIPLAQGKTQAEPEPGSPEIA